MHTKHGRLDSWKAIASYLGRDVSTVIRWEKERGLPVHRVPGGGRQAIFALTSELDAWLVGNDSGAGSTATSTPSPEPSPRPRADRPRHVARWLAPAVLGAASVVLVGWYVDAGSDPLRDVAAGDVPAYSRSAIQLSSAYSLATADLNGDGRLDFVVTGYKTNLLHTYLGRGDGTFVAAGEAATGVNPDGVVLADFSGDGILDAATANRGSNTVSLLLGTGTGTFHRRVEHHVAGGPRGVAAGDIDGDGSLDLAVTSFDAATVTTFLARDGRLRQSRVHAIGTDPYQVRLADLNRDGRMDVVVSDARRPPRAAIGLEDQFTAGILLGTREEEFRLHSTYRLGTGPSGIAVADLDRDGRLDVAIPNFYGHELFILRGHGDGTFRDATTLDTGLGPLDVIAVDVDADGVLDLVTTNTRDRGLSIHRGRGDGTFEPKVDVTADSYPKSVVAGDFDGNGSMDFVVANYLAENITVLLSRRHDRLTAATRGAMPFALGRTIPGFGQPSPVSR